MTSPVDPWAPVRISAIGSGESSIYQVASGTQNITVNTFATGQPLSIVALREWIERLAQACAADVPTDRAARKSARHRAQVIDDIGRDLADSGRQAKGKDCLRRLLVTGTVQYFAKVHSTAPGRVSQMMILDLLVFALWPVIQAPRLPRGWQGHLVELTSPLVAQVAIDAREASTRRQPVDVPVLSRALAACQLASAASNLLEDLGDPARGYGTVTAVAMAARLPTPAQPGIRSVIAWLVAGATGAASVATTESAIRLITDMLNGVRSSDGATQTGDVVPGIGVSGEGGGPGARKHLSSGVDPAPDASDVMSDFIDDLFR